MSDTNKTRYEVQKILSEVISEGLSAYIGNNHGFVSMEFGQAAFTKGDRLILLKQYSTQRYGWQGRNYNSADGKFYRTEKWIDRQMWQIHVIMKKVSNPTVESLQADDIGNFIITWFNGQGCDSLRKRGIAPERTSEASIVVYDDDSDLYQKRAVIMVRLQVPKEITTEVDSMHVDSQYDEKDVPTKQGIFSV